MLKFTYIACEISEDPFQETWSLLVAETEASDSDDTEVRAA